MANVRGSDDERRDTKTGDFSDRADLDELGGSTSDGILEVARQGANTPSHEPGADNRALEANPQAPSETVDQDPTTV